MQIGVFSFPYDEAYRRIPNVQCTTHSGTFALAVRRTTRNIVSLLLSAIVLVIVAITVVVGLSSFLLL